MFREGQPVLELSTGYQVLTGPACLRRRLRVLRCWSLPLARTQVVGEVLGEVEGVVWRTHKCW
eukprot:2334223-Rhodomonas_salina.1